MPPRPHQFKSKRAQPAIGQPLFLLVQQLLATRPDSALVGFPRKTAAKRVGSAAGESLAPRPSRNVFKAPAPAADSMNSVSF